MSDQYSVRLAPGAKVYKVSTVQDPLADVAYKIYTQKKETDALYYLTFVGTSLTSLTANKVYTSSNIAFNPTSGILSVGGNLGIGSNGIFYGAPSFFIGNLTTTGVTSFGGNIKIGGNQIISSSGQAAIGLGNSDAFFYNNVTVENDLVIKGSFISNNPTFSIGNRTIDLGFNTGIVTNTTWDLGVVFNYNESNTRKKTALIWEYSNKRFQFANEFITTDTGNNYTTPQLSVTSFAPIEIKSLWLNDSCTSGPQQIIGCINNEITLQNTVIDEGEY